MFHLTTLLSKLIMINLKSIIKGSLEARERLLRHEISLSPGEIVASLETFIAHVGLEHVNPDRFMRFLFHKHKPLVIERRYDEVCCNFTPLTRKRALCIVEKLLDDAVEADLEKQQDAIAKLARVQVKTILADHLAGAPGMALRAAAI